MHPIDERLALFALATSYVELAVLAHFLGTRQSLQGCHDVTTRVARHHHVECVHRLEVVTLAEAEGAGCHYHFIDGCSPLFHADIKIGQLAYTCCQQKVVIADKGGLEGYFAFGGCGKCESSQGVGEATVDRTYYI